MLSPAEHPLRPKILRTERVLTKPGISGELQDLLVLWGKEALRGCQAPAHQPPAPQSAS